MGLLQVIAMNFSTYTSEHSCQLVSSRWTVIFAIVHRVSQEGEDYQMFNKRESIAGECE